MEKEQEVDTKTKEEVFKERKETTKGSPFDLMKPVIARVKKRMKELQEVTQAKHEKVMMGNKVVWHTTPPKMFISQLEARVQNGVGTITFYKYKTKNGNKEAKVTKSTMPSGKEYEVSAEYIIDVLHKEVIEFGKQIKVEEVKM